MATIDTTKPFHVLAALGAGCLMTLMVHLNGELGRYGSPLFSSWVAHGAGSVVAVMAYVVLRRPGNVQRFTQRAPLWAYIGGLSGALTVILTSVVVNTPLALSGTLALGLVGQGAFSLAADRWGFFGLEKRLPTLRDFLSLMLVVAGSLVIIFFGRSGA